ncbi:unnamed protein product, partial [Effrenium voratum]
KEADCAAAFREALTDRYLLFVNSSIPDDCYPVNCVPGDGYSLREHFCSGAGKSKDRSKTEAAASKADKPEKEKTEKTEKTETAAFVLRRCGSTPVPGVLRPAPETFSVRHGQRLAFGREDTCDVVLRHQHVSKVHATFVLQKSPEGVGHMLLMQDGSSNGTWINGAKMTPGRFQQLDAGDRISFLAPTESLEEDPATWEAEEAFARTALG